MSLNGLKVEIAFGSAPRGIPSWTDVTNDVQSIQTSRGRSTALDVYEAGTAQITLRNTTAKYDPLNAAGPYYGQLVPGVSVRVSMLDSTSTRQNIITGFVQLHGGWSFVTDWKNSTATVAVVDFFSVLANITMPAALALNQFAAMLLGELQIAGSSGDSGTEFHIIGTLPYVSPTLVGERAGTFVTGVEAAGGFHQPYQGLTTSDAGETLVQGFVGGQKALEWLQMVAKSEGGAIYVLRDGTLQFDTRHAPLKVSRMTTSQCTFGEGGVGEVPYLLGSLTIDYATQLYNSATITPETFTSPNLTAQTFTDATSITNYTESDYTESGLLMDSIPEALARAEQLVNRWSTPIASPAQLTVKGRRSDVARDCALQRELRDRVVVKFTAPAAAQVSKDCVVERIVHSIDLSANDWSTTFSFSDATQAGFDDPATFLTLDGTRKWDGTYHYAP